MAENVFNRFEMKYLMTEEKYEELRRKLAPHMAVDGYGLHTICNIYYDTTDDLLVRRSIEKPVYKEKLRLRSYGIPGMDSMVYLEIKKKYKKVVNKRRVSLTLREAYDFADRGIRPFQKAQWTENQILSELDFFLSRYSLQRRLYLAYDRIALFGYEDQTFRVTFDRNIRSRRSLLSLECGDRGEALLPEGCCLMENKVMGSVPLWFTGILSELKIFPTSFSKYGSVYKKEHGRFDTGELLRLGVDTRKDIRRGKAC